MTQPSNTTILEMRNISKAFGGVQALRDVSFTCRIGQVHALVGENGAGKSTLIKILSGGYQADSGEIIYKDQRYENLSTYQALNGGIRVIYQELNLIPYLSVAENIFLGHEPRTRFGLIDYRSMYRKTHDLLAQLGQQLDPKTLVGDLTIAVQQMIEIAKALSREAELLVMDEPSAILAGDELEHLFAIINSLRKQGVTIVYISHRLDEIFQIADEVTVLKDGLVIGTHAIEEVNRPRLIQMMVGRELSEIFPRGSGSPGEPILQANDMVTEHLPQPFTLTLRQGEIVGLAGMVGSGRTELARALFGADPLQSGLLSLNGRKMTVKNPHVAIASGMALVPEDRKEQGLFMGLPVGHNITIVTLARLVRLGIIRHTQETQVVNKAQQNLAINMASLHQEVRFLSGGNQQKVVLAKWLETAPSVVILDEPTRGVDVGAKFEIYQLMRQMTDQGVAVLMISSELQEILGMSDRILVMHDRRIVGELSRDEASEESIMELATTGRTLDAVASPMEQ